MWVAGKRQKVKRNGVYVWIEPGEDLPEAENWTNQKKLVRWRFIRWIDRPEDTVSTKAEEKKDVVAIEVKPIVKVEPELESKLEEPKPESESEVKTEIKIESKPKKKSKSKSKKSSK